MSWYFFGGFSAYATEPSARVVEPVGVLLDPRVVGRALERQVERDLQSEAVRVLHEGVEVLHPAELRVDRVVAALGRADRPGGARVVRLGVQGVVRALAERRADRVDRREVEDVEAHLGHGGQAFHRAAEGPDWGPRRAQRVERARPRSGGNELVPGAEEGAAARCTTRGYRAVAVTCSRSGCRSIREWTSGAFAASRPRHRRDRDLPQRARHRRSAAERLPAGTTSAARSNSRAPSSHMSSTSWPRGILMAASCHQVRERVAPGLHAEVPGAELRCRDLRGVPGGAGDRLVHGRQRARTALGVAHDDSGTEHLVPLAEHGRGDLEVLIRD